MGHHFRLTIMNYSPVIWPSQHKANDWHGTHTGIQTRLKRSPFFGNYFI